MYRCAFAAVGAALAVVCAPASAQVSRQFPQDALRGVLAVTMPPEVALNGVPARLAPGARIRGADNMLVQSASIAGQRFVVNYTVDANGQIRDAWILRADEAARRPWPTTPQEAAAWSFDPVAQVWVKP